MLNTNIEKSLRTKRRRFEIDHEDYEALKYQAIYLNLGTGQYVKFWHLVNETKSYLTKNQCRTLLKDLLSGLTYEQWSNGKYVKRPGLELNPEQMQVAISLSEYSSNEDLFTAIVDTARLINKGKDD